MLAKTLVRAGIIIGSAVLVPAFVLLTTRHLVLDGAALGFFALWMALVIAYGLFWFALSALVNSLGRASATNALLLISTWVLLVLVVPVALNLAVSKAHPAPSRTDLATQTRLVTIDGLRRYENQFSQEYDDRPEALLPKDGRLDVASRMRAYYLMEEFVDQRLTEVLARFDRQLAAQQVLVDRFSFISPAIVANEGMASLAGNGTRRYERFKHQVIGYHEAWRGYFVPRMRNGIAIVEAVFARFPRWSWQEENAVTVRADALIKIAHFWRSPRSWRCSQHGGSAGGSRCSGGAVRLPARNVDPSQSGEGRFGHYPCVDDPCGAAMSTGRVHPCVRPVRAAPHGCWP
ncbi:DUF3526 domain-containing protein [Sphingomonas koreensis]